MTPPGEGAGAAVASQQLVVLGERRAAAGGGGDDRDPLRKGAGVPAGERAGEVREAGVEMERAAAALACGNQHLPPVARERLDGGAGRFGAEVRGDATDEEGDRSALRCVAGRRPPGKRRLAGTSGSSRSRAARPGASRAEDRSQGAADSEPSGEAQEPHDQGEHPRTRHHPAEREPFQQPRRDGLHLLLRQQTPHPLDDRAHLDSGGAHRLAAAAGEALVDLCGEPGGRLEPPFEQGAGR